MEEENDALIHDVLSDEYQPPEIRCSFCGKKYNEVKKLIAGPAVFICNECLDLCNSIMEDEK